MDQAAMKARTKAFALRILRLMDALPRSAKGRLFADQLGRAGTAVAANYRAACRGRSDAEFIAKIGVVLEEADESALWLELMIDNGVMKKARLDGLLREAEELTAIMAATRLTTMRRTSFSKRESGARRKNLKSEI
jgi:four helix bundle protein